MVDGLGAPPQVRAIVVDPPGPDELVVRLVASGVCHSDAWAVEHGNWGDPFPMLLGHEELTRVCLLGCGASTGVGAAINTAGVRADDTVSVIGLGGIGLSAMQGACIAGATRVIAVDVVPAKLERAFAFGATDVVDASARDPVAAVRTLTDGEGVDVALEAIGVASVVPQAMAMLARGGTAVAIGVPPPDSSVTIRWSGGEGAAYPTKSTLRITDGGDPVLEDFIRWLDWTVDGRLDLDGMVTRGFELTDADLAESFRAMLAGEVIRSVVRIGAA